MHVDILHIYNFLEEKQRPAIKRRQLVPTPLDYLSCAPKSKTKTKESTYHYFFKIKSTNYSRILLMWNFIIAQRPH